MTSNSTAAELAKRPPQKLSDNIEARILAWQTIDETDDLKELTKLMHIWPHPPTLVELCHAQSDTAILELQDMLPQVIALEASKTVGVDGLEVARKGSRQIERSGMQRQSLEVQ